MNATPLPFVADLFEPEPERYELRDAAGPLLGPVDRRSFLKMMGGGLVVLCLVRDREAEAQQPKAGGRRPANDGPREIGAWVHVAEDGTVTAHSGKAEVGQNARTSLSMAVADELKVPLATVRLTLADTDRVPFDQGTFGSRTTPSMVPQIRRAAAAARALLVGLAAERLGVDRQALVVAEGRVTHPPTGRSLGYGELTHGRRLVEAIDDATPIAGPDRWEIAGTSPTKVDGRDFVTGRHAYASDVTRPGALHGKVLRPPAYGATLRSLDDATARAMPGVVVVRDGDFVGVVAADEPAAEAALDALRPDWKTPDSPISEDDLFDGFRTALAAKRPTGGAVGEALARSEVKLEAEFTIAYIAHTPLEPRAAVAEWAEDRLTVWTGTQRPFGVRAELARAFGLAEDKVRVIVPDTGSGYGGKHTGEAAIEATRLAKAAGKPVKLTWTRAEEFTWAYNRPAGLIVGAVGATRDGTLTAWDFHNVNSGGSGLRSPYRVGPKVEAFHEARSPLRQGSYRALAATANHFARESLIDELARTLGADPLAFRLKNLDDPRMIAVLKAAAERFGWGRPKAGPDRGVGLACGAEKGGYVATCAEVTIDKSAGSVKVVRAVIAFECGAVIHPEHLENQVEGALVQGLGGALFERVRYRDGRVVSDRLSRYRVPRFGDVPAIEVVLVDRRDLPSAGAGETPIVAIAPAIGNAIADATGVRLRSLPMVPEGLKT